MELKVCRRNKYGYCKYGDTCHFRHEMKICFESSCNIFDLEMISIHLLFFCLTWRDMTLATQCLGQGPSGVLKVLQIVEHRTGVGVIVGVIWPPGIPFGATKTFYRPQRVTTSRPKKLHLPK